jgi:hypothetical protein
MKIKWISHPNKPELNGTEQHVARELAHVAVGYGQAELCPMPKRGTNEYLAMRAEQSRLSVPQANDVAIPYIDPPQWQAFDSDGSNFSVCRIVKKHGFESTSFKEPPADCPPNVAKRWREMKGATPQPAIDAAAREEAREAQEAYNQRAKTFRRY